MTQSPDEDFPKLDSNLQLDSTESIYKHETRDRIRETLAGQDVLMVDVDGVLTESPNEEGRAPYREGITALRELHQRGYWLIIWSQGGRGTTEDDRLVQDFLNHNLKDVSRLVVLSNNCKIETSEDRRNFQDTVKEAYWLGDEAQEKLIKKYGISDQKVPGPKTPYLFAARCGVVDDGCYNIATNLPVGTYREVNWTPDSKFAVSGATNAPIIFYRVGDNNQRTGLEKLGMSGGSPDKCFGMPWTSIIENTFPRTKK